MSKGNRPAISIAVKPVGGDKNSRVYALAGWPNDAQGGKVTSLQLDRRIKAVKFLLDDGTVVHITRGEGGSLSHYFDLFDNREPKTEPAGVISRRGYGSAPSNAGGFAAPAAEPELPFDAGDQIPF